MKIHSHVNDSPRVVAAFFFTLLSFIGFSFVEYILSKLGFKELLPFWPSLLLTLLASATAAAILGKKIIHCPKPYRFKCFSYGFLLVLIGFLVFCLGLLFIFPFYHPDLYQPDTGLLHHFLLYSFFVIYGFVFFGFLIAIVCGFAAIYLRAYFVDEFYYLLSKLRRNRYASTIR